jgi:DNA repair protein RadD
MMLRPYQEVAVSSAFDALDKHSNTIVVAPTGAGKTIMLSALVGQRHDKNKNVLILQHRDELVAQNKDKFLKVNPLINTSIVDGTQKNWEGDVIFSMVQTISRDKNLNNLRPIDMLVIDESHHAAASTYKKVIKKVRSDNPNSEIVGFTATPNRGDKQGLRDIFTNCCHQIEVATLIREGFLVPIKAYVVDVGVQDELNDVRKTVDDFDMAEVESIMNKKVINQKVVTEWEHKASDRKTVVFCSTILHAKDLLQEFLDVGVKADIVTSETSKDDRKEILHDLEFGDTQVVVNVAVLTEGFDAPPISCIVLTRPCSYKSTMVQMIGRGLRTIDPEIYPNIIKKDCIVLDFGTSILTHGSVDETVNLDGRDPSEAGEAPQKTCPSCEAIIPLNVKECPMCSFEFGSQSVSEEVISTFQMTEIELIDRSPFRWIDMCGNGSMMMACGFEGFGLIATVDDTSIAIVKKSRGKIRTIAIGSKNQAIASADDFMREIETSDSANKSKRWLNSLVSEKQINHLSNYNVNITAFDLSWNRYRANCWLNYFWNRNIIDSIVYNMGA